MTYNIIAKTNPWIASHNTLFNGKERVALHENLTLEEANKMMLDYFNKESARFARNWGLARIFSHMPDNTCEARTHDGFRAIEYDSKYIFIEQAE